MKKYWSSIPGKFVDALTGVSYNDRSGDLFRSFDNFPWYDTLPPCIYDLMTDRQLPIECGRFAYKFIKEKVNFKNDRLVYNQNVPESVVQIGVNQLEILDLND